MPAEGLNELVNALPVITTTNCPGGVCTCPTVTVSGTQINFANGSCVLQTMTGIGLSNNAILAGLPAGTLVGVVNVTMSPSTPTFNGQLSLVAAGGNCAGGDLAHFQLSGSNLLTAGTSVIGSYPLCIQAAETTSTTNSPFTQSATVAVQAIQTVSLSNNNIVAGQAAGAVVGQVSVVMNPQSPSFSGTLSLSGTNAADFTIVGNTVRTSVSIAAGTYNLNIVASQGGVSVSQPETITAVQQTIAQVVLTNTAIIGGTGSANQLVGNVHVVMSPQIPAFSGTLSLTGANAGTFALSGSSVHVGGSDVTNGSTYNFNVVATQAGTGGSPFTQAEVVTPAATTWVNDQTQPMPYVCINNIWINPSPSVSGATGGGKLFAAGGVGSQAAPFKTITDLWSSQIPISPGTCVKVLNTAILYDWSVFGSVSAISRSLNLTSGFYNAPDGYWVIQSTDNTGAPVRAVSDGGVIHSTAAHMVSSNLSGNHIGNLALTQPTDYLILDGMNLEMDGAQRTQLQLTCVLVGGQTHFQARYNYIHGCSNGGFNIGTSDYVSLHTNVIKTTTVDSILSDQESGISVGGSYENSAYTPLGYDSQLCTTMNGSCVHYHQIVSGNTVSDPYIQNLTTGVTDGNCMIVDTNVWSASQTNFGAYLYRLLIANNLFYNCGQAGIEGTVSQHVDVVNNTGILSSINLTGNNGTARGVAISNNTLDWFWVNNILYNIGADTFVKTTGTGTTLSVDNVRYYLASGAETPPSPSCNIQVTIDGIANTIVAPPAIDPTNVSTTPGGASGTITLGTAVASPHGNSGVLVVATNTFSLGCGGTVGVNASPTYGFGGTTVTTCINDAQPGPTCPGGSTYQIAFNDSSVFYYNNWMQLIDNAYLIGQGNTAGNDYCLDCAQPPSQGPPGNNPYLVDPGLTTTFFSVSPNYEVINASVNGGSSCTAGEIVSLAGGSPVGGDAASIQVDAVASGVPITSHLFHTGTYPSNSTVSFTEGSTTGTCTGLTFTSVRFMQVFQSTSVPDIHLQGGSAALGTGNSSYCPSHNFFGTARSCPTVNIGAY